MAFASVGTIGTNASGTSNQASIVLTTTATVEAGNLAVVWISVDNIGATDADHSEVASVVDSAGGNTWVKLREWTNGQGSERAGATVAVWGSRLQNQLTSTETITATFNSSTNRNATAISGWEFTVANPVSVASATELAGDGADPAAITLSGLASKEYLFLWGIAVENPPTTTITQDADYTAITHAGQGTGAAGMSVGGGFRILTGTGDTVDASTSLARDHVQVFIALQEDAAGGFAVSVADTGTLTEATTLLLLSFVNLSDLATLAETITATLVSLVTVNETATLTENANALIVSHVTVDETVTTTEAVSALLVSFISTSETVTLSEAVTATVSDPQVSASDTATLTEAVSLLITSLANVSETATVSEAVAVTVSDPQVVAGETVTVSETVTTLITSFVNVSEAATVSEAVSAAIEDVAGNPQVVASETVTVSESVTVVTSGPQVVAAETVTLTEITTLALMTTVNVSELVTLSEALTIPPLLLAGVNVGEAVTLTETLTLSGLAVIVTILGSVTGVRATGTVTGVRATGTLRG